MAVWLLYNVFIFTRLVILKQPHLWGRAGCPQCQSRNLTRLRGQQMGRFLKYLGFPVRRYSCQNCGWEGTRFRHRKRRAPIDELL